MAAQIWMADPKKFIEESWASKFGSLFEGLKEVGTKPQLLYNFFLLLRRLIFSLACIYLGDHQMAQL